MIRLFVWIVLCFAFALSSFGQANQPMASVNTIADLTGRYPNGPERVQVLGWRVAGDWGTPRTARHVPGSTTATNLGCVFIPVEDIGRWVFDDCASGEVDARWFSAVGGDGTTDDTVALQAVIDWASEQLTVNPNSAYSNAFGATIRFPDNNRFLHSGLQLKRGVRMIGRSPSDKPYPGDNSMPRFLLKAASTSPSFYATIYTNHLGNWEGPGGITLQGLIIDGQYDLQNTNDFRLHGLYVNGGSTLYAKGWTIEGCAFVDHVGYSIFSMGGLGASTIRDCFLGSGLFTTIVADLKLESSDITGRTRGAASATNAFLQPFPAWWAADYTVKNIGSDLMVYIGPTASNSMANSLRSWAVSSYDATADTVTLATTNSLHEGLPLVWRSTGGHTVGINSNLTYYVTPQGSSVFKLSTIAGFLANPRTYTDLTNTTVTDDKFQFGEAAVAFFNGSSSTSYNLWSNVRIEDAHADILRMDGVYVNTFLNCGLGTTYDAASKFIRITGEAFGNVFSGGWASWSSPNNNGSQPWNILYVTSGSRGNKAQGMVILGAVTNNILDDNRTFPGNNFDYQIPTQNETAGLTWTQRFVDFDATVTNFWVWDSQNWYMAPDTTASISSKAKLAFIGANSRLEVHGDTYSPQFWAGSYGAATGPRLDFMTAGGTRASQTATPAGGLGNVFFAGHDGTNQTSARAVVKAVAPFGWGTTNGSSAELAFETTPFGSYTRSEKIRFLGYGGIQVSEQSTPPLTPATNTFALFSSDASSKLTIKWDTGLTNNFWTDGNDGTGSGLDADLLDGNESSVFSQTNHLHTGVYLPLVGGTVTGPIIVTNDPVSAYIQIWNNPVYFYDSDTPTEWGQIIYNDAGFLQLSSTVGGIQLLGASVTLPYIPLESIPSTNQLRFVLTSTNAAASANDANKVVMVDTNDVKSLLGISSTNTLSIAGFTYTATNLYDDLMYYVSELNPVGVGTPPDIIATSGRDSEALAAVYNANDTLIINAQLPHTWATGTVVYPHLHIEPQTTGAITNTWRVEHSVADIGGVFPAWTVVTNTITIDAANQWTHKLVGLPTAGIDMTGKVGPSTMIRIRAECLSVNVDTHVLAVDLHYQVRGSPVVYTP